MRGDESPPFNFKGDNFRERIYSLRKTQRSPSIVNPMDDHDVLHSAALDMTSKIVQNLL